MLKKKVFVGGAVELTVSDSNQADAVYSLPSNDRMLILSPTTPLTPPWFV